jgi:DNA-binding IclR family transcriptional regulator
MARPAPGIERAVNVLNFLAAHPDEEFTLSELARRLHLNKATSHAMLAALTDAGYLLRHPARRTYTLGPALIALGNAAQFQFEAVEFARDEMRSLSEQLGLECLASTAVGDEIVIVARAGTPQPLGVSVQLGQRLPLVPPLGTVFLAWAEPTEIDRWLRRLGPSADPAQLERCRAALAAVRERGYAVALEADARARLGRAVAELAQAPSRGRGREVVEELVEELGQEEYILLELEHAATYRINHISAPVFGPEGKVELTLTLVGFRDQLSAGQVPEYAERLLAAAVTVTKSIHGTAPS